MKDALDMYKRLLSRDQGDRRDEDQLLSRDEDQDYPDHLKVARCLNGMGMILEAQGDMENAQKYMERALEMSQRLLKEAKDKDKEADALNSKAHFLNNLGDILIKMNRSEKGVEHCEQALAIRKSLHPEKTKIIMLPSLKSLVEGYGALGQYKEALTTLKEAMRIAWEVYTPDHPKLKEYLLSLVKEEEAGAESDK